MANTTSREERGVRTNADALTLRLPRDSRCALWTAPTVWTTPSPTRHRGTLLRQFESRLDPVQRVRTGTVAIPSAGSAVTASKSTDRSRSTLAANTFSTSPWETPSPASAPASRSVTSVIVV